MYRRSRSFKRRRRGGFKSRRFFKNSSRRRHSANYRVINRGGGVF